MSIDSSGIILALRTNFGTKIIDGIIFALFPERIKPRDTVDENCHL